MIEALSFLFHICRPNDSFTYTLMDGKQVSIDKTGCFRMMIWLCAYYEFFEKEVICMYVCSPYLPGLYTINSYFVNACGINFVCVCVWH